MIKTIIPKPEKRSYARKIIGKKAFILRRYFKWYFTGNNFASTKQSTPLGFSHINHSSVLIRELKNVDLWLQHNKIDNLKIAIQEINNILIRPGETFSFWYLVGNPSKKRGFKLGMTLQNGLVSEGYGGGLCQLANLLYYLAIHSPLAVTERWRHGFDVFPDVNRTIPFGCGATVSFNYIDLQLKNNTDQNFQLNLWLTEKELCGEIRSDKEPLFNYEIIEKNHLILHEPWGGYSRHNQLFRKKYNKASGIVIEEEFLTENHAIMMYNPMLPSHGNGCA